MLYFGMKLYGHSMESNIIPIFICILGLSVRLNESNTGHEDLDSNAIPDHEVEGGFPQSVPSNKPNQDHYGYTRLDGPEKWARMFLTCGGIHQSPINLDTSTALIIHKPQQNWWGYALKPSSMSLSNNGHTVVLRGEWDNQNIPYNWDADMDDVYIFDQLHFHWGPNDESGSEHTLNNEKFPLEMHAVHYRRNIGTMGQAAKVPGGLKVIGILFRISEHRNAGLSDILNGLSQVQNALETAKITPFALTKLIPQFSRQYLTYNGSLTTPPCSESVKWVVYKQAASISRDQVDKFRHFINEGTIINKNYRPPQPLNDRIVQQIK